MVFVCAGATAAVALAFALVGKGGTVLLYAPPPPGETVLLDPNRVFFEELSIKGAYSTSPFETREALDMLLAGEVDVDRLITHRLPLAETGPALKMAAVAGESLKIVIDPRR